MSLPFSTLSDLLALQDVEDHKFRLSKLSWLPDILVFRSSIIPTVAGPVLSVTLFAAGVAAAALWWGKEVGLTNNVVPLLSVVVALLLVFRNSSAYERYAEGRKDFTTLISNARNLSRNIWVAVSLPPSPPAGTTNTVPAITREQLTEEKRKLIRLIVAFVVATKHHLRAEGGVHHEDLRGLLSARLAGSTLTQLRVVPSSTDTCTQQNTLPETGNTIMSSPAPLTGSLPTTPTSERPNPLDEESQLGITSSLSHPTLSHRLSIQSGLSQQHSGRTHPSRFKSALNHLKPERAGLKRRPTNVRIVLPEDAHNRDYGMHRAISRDKAPLHNADVVMDTTERTPLIKAGVKPDIRRTPEDVERSLALMKNADVGLGKMVELGLPLIIAHEMSRMIFRFRRMGCLESVGPAGMNAMQGLVQSMTDQLGSMERIVQTPLPVLFGVHLKQCVTLFLFILPFTLVDLMGWKMVFIVTCCAFTMMGVEHIAAEMEMPFGTDPCDLNLDLFCVELRCECEAIIERLAEGDVDDVEVMPRSVQQVAEDDLGADDDGGDDAE